MIRSISTVNVIDFADQACCCINGMVSFPDTDDGVKAAQGVFKAWVEDAAADDDPPSAEDLENALDDGRFEVGESVIIIVHSTVGSSEYPTE